MQEVTDVEVLPLQKADQEQPHFRRTNLQEDHATQPQKAQLETQLEKAQKSVHSENPLDSTTVKHEMQLLTEEELLLMAENLTERITSNLKIGRKNLQKRLLPLKQQRMEYV